MAAGQIIVPGAMPTRDRNGRATVGKLFFYEDGTQTPAPVYTTSALTIELANPVVSDSAGRFPAIWADDAELFTVVWTYDDEETIQTYSGVSAADDAVLASVALAEAAADEAAADAVQTAADLAAIQAIEAAGSTAPAIAGKLNRDGDNAEAGLYAAIGEQTTALTAATDVQDGDLLASYRSTGPLKKLTAAAFSEYIGGELTDNGTIPSVSSRTALAGLTIKAAIKQLATRGYSAEGDDGGWDKAVRTSFATITLGGYPASSYQRSLDRFMPDGSTDAVNGGYWLNTDSTVTPAMAGASLQAAVDLTAIDNGAVSLDGITYSVATTIDLDASVGAGGLTGQGQERTIVRQTGTNPVVTANGQNQRFDGLTLDYETLVAVTDTNAACLQLSGLQFSEVRNLRLKNGYYGLYCDGIDHGSEFQNTFDNIRVRNWIRSAFRFDTGSGSFHSNLYMSAIESGSVLYALECANFSSEFLRTNIERSTIIDSGVRLVTGHDVSFIGLNYEEISVISRGFYDGVTEVSGSMIYTTGQGYGSAQSWIVDTCHVGGYMVTRTGGMVRTGSTVRAYLDLMKFQQKLISGHGIKVGYSIYVEGASDALYNGAWTVTDAGLDWVEFTISGTPTTPAAIASGSDCICVSIGNQSNTANALVHMEGNARLYEIDGLHIRDMRVIAHTAARRQTQLRFLRAGTNTPAKLKVKNLVLGPQRSVFGHWLEPRRITGYKRVSNVATVVFDQPHNLRADSILTIYAASDAAINVTTGALTIVSETQVSFANTGSDTASSTWVRDGATRAVLQAFAISTIARSGDYATITTTADHGLYDATEADGAGLRVAIRSSDTSINTVDSLILEVPSTTTFIIRNVGADQAATAATGSVQLIECGLTVASMSFGGSSAPIVEVEGWEDFTTVLTPGSISALGSVTATNTIAARYSTTRDRIEIVSAPDLSPLLTIKGVVSSTNQHQIIIGNPTAGAVTQAPFIINYRVVRG